ncbi:MAG: universal stress protein [Dermatophilaceae bacterium]
MKTPAPIVVGVDGSPSSLEALTWAVRQAALTGAGVEAVIAWEYPPLSGVDPTTAHVDWRTKAQQTIDETLARGEGADGVEVSSVVIAGHPAEVLVEASAGAQLLVVGNRGRGAFTEMRPGSVREQVIAQATCPVLVMCHPAQAVPSSE